MKPSFLILVLALVLLAGVICGYVFITRGTGPSITPTPTVAPTGTPLPTPDDMIIIDSPQPGSSITSPLIVTGRARGTWYFEASFPVVLTDWDGRIIAQTPAQAQGDWMTTDFVPFVASLSFTPVVMPNNRGTLILQKDNPSGDPAHDDSREVPVVFQ